MSYIEEETYKLQDFSKNPLELASYELCTFVNCNFSGADLSNMKFGDCKFLDCNLSNGILHNTSFQDVKFTDCKMLGLHFEQCNEFGLVFEFENCVLTHSSFYQCRIRKTVVKNSLVHDVDFTECDLTAARFENCDFAGAVFDHSILEKADFTTSFKYSIDPETNRIKKAKFSQDGLAGLLGKYNIEISKY